MLVSMLRRTVVVLETGPVARSKITKKRDERTEGGNQEIIERTKERRIYPTRPVLSIHLLFKSRSSRVRHACKISLIRFICLSSDVGQLIKDFEPTDTL